MRSLTRLFILSGVSALAACAAQGPTASSGPGGSAPASSAVASTSTHQVPDGYQREVINGEERFCRNDTDTGSRVARTKVCYTWEEVQAQERTSIQITRGSGPVN